MSPGRQRRAEFSSLRIGVDEAPPPPLNFGTPGSPEFRGFEVDMLEALTARLGVSATYRSALWKVIFDELVSGRLDAVCGAATVTEERRRTVEFSDPYLDVHLVLVVRSDGRVNSIEDLAARQVGVRKETEAEQYLVHHAPSAQLQRFDLNTDQYQALEAARVEAIVDDSPIAGYFVKARSGLRIAARLEGTDAQYAIALAKSNTRLRSAINAALAELRQDGTLERLRNQWFDDLSSDR